MSPLTCWLLELLFCVFLVVLGWNRWTDRRHSKLEPLPVSSSRQMSLNVLMAWWTDDTQSWNNFLCLLLPDGCPSISCWPDGQTTLKAGTSSCVFFQTGDTMTLMDGPWWTGDTQSWVLFLCLLPDRWHYDLDGQALMDRWHSILCVLFL